MKFKIETIKWIEGYEHEIFLVEAESEELAKKLVESGEVDSEDGWVDIKNNDSLEIITIQED